MRGKAWSHAIWFLGGTGQGWRPRGPSRFVLLPPPLHARVRRPTRLLNRSLDPVAFPPPGQLRRQRPEELIQPGYLSAHQPQPRAVPEPNLVLPIGRLQ